MTACRSAARNGLVDMGVSRTELQRVFSERFGHGPELLVVSPGRTEIAGNHTDHEGGHVIAAAIDRAVTGLARATTGDEMRLVSLGFGELAIRLNDLAPREGERGTTAALVRGMAAQFVERGFSPTGFDLACASEVLGGSGLSSSAAFELGLAQAMNALWADGSVAADDLALMAQRTERVWFGKPCGLMDQAAVALGGIQHMDFSDPSVLVAHDIAFDFDEAGHAICIIAVGADHAANIDDYAAVPAEMQAVARELGRGVLSEVDEADVIAALPQLRATLGDRAALRALHYFREERLVAGRVAALRAGDVGRFLALTRLSGASSAMYLQNVSVGGAREQPSMLALALAEELLGDEGAARVHGGGFGGTIQAFVPRGRIEGFSQAMDAVFGEGACGRYAVDHEGAKFAWLR